jgi:hypothetical protein
MVKENMTAKKKRYICVSIDGMEIYIEDISVGGSIKDQIPAAKLRLREIRRIMPLGKWSIRIEQQWPNLSGRHYQYIDVEEGKLKEKVI